MAESSKQKRVTGRVMHEFKHGELTTGAGGKGEKVKSRRQAIAIALSESGASNRQTPSRNARNLRRSERNEAQGRTAQQEREGKSHVGADGQRKSAHTRQDLYVQAQKKGVAGRSRMSKSQLENALRLN